MEEAWCRVVEYQSFLAMSMRDALGTAALAGFNLSINVLGFALTARSTVRRVATPNTCVLKASSPEAADFGRLVGDRIASAIVGSPFYPFLKKQAKDAMKEGAENIGVKWDEEVTRLREARDWDAALTDLIRDSTIETSPEYLRPFHTYPEGNLCWEAAWEQHLASQAVGVRNFPNDARNGERLFREAYEKQMERLGVVVEKGGLVVDVGCGTGTSTRRLADQFPTAGRVIGFDLSPHMVLVGQFMTEKKENTDPRVELRYTDGRNTGLPDGSASLVSICLVFHEMWAEGRREMMAEAYRILRPGGSLAIMEMDPSAPGFVSLRQNPIVFSIMRSTEPYLEVYFSEADNIDAELQEAGFSTVRKSMATGRHFTVVAMKGGSLDMRSGDERPDTHVQSHKASFWLKSPTKSSSGRTP